MKKNIVLILIIVAMSIMSCSTDGFFIGGGSASGDYVPESSAIGSDLEPGQLTAGEWNDLESWDFWTNLLDTTYDSMKSYWCYYPDNRYVVRVLYNGNPANDIPVSLNTYENTTVWSARTDNSGDAYLYSSLFSSQETSLYIKVVNNNETIIVDNVQPTEAGKTIEVELGTSPETADIADIMFVIDTTGSMSDELEYLKTEIQDVITRIGQQNSDTTLRVSCNFYRDHGDEYVVRPYSFTEDLNTVVQQISNQHANGGGDYPEAVEEALNNAINSHEWSTSAKTRLLFLVCDAPPHHTEEIISTLHSVTETAAENGIRIIPVASSGVDKETEFLLRFLDISTGGTYIFLTDDSGIGNSHINPTVGEYTVEYLNDLLVRVINGYLQ